MDALSYKTKFKGIGAANILDRLFVLSTDRPLC